MRSTVCHALQQYCFGTAACFLLCFILPGPCYTPVRSGEYRQDESDLGKVLAAMKSDKAYEVQHAIESLLAVEKWRVAAIPHLVERLSDEREPDENIFGPNFTIADQAGEALATIGKPAVPALQKVIVERGNDEARIRAIEALGQIGYDAADAVSALCSCVRDENELIRYHAVVSLGKVAPNPKRVLAPLTEALDDQDPDVKSAAVLALGAMGPKAEAALPRLVIMLDTNDLRSDWPTWLPLRIDVAEAIGKIGKRESMAIAKLEPMLQDKDPLVRIGAALAHCQLSADPTPGLGGVDKGASRSLGKHKNSMSRCSCAWRTWTSRSSGGW